MVFIKLKTVIFRFDSILFYSKNKVCSTQNTAASTIIVLLQNLVYIFLLLKYGQSTGSGEREKVAPANKRFITWANFVSFSSNFFDTHHSLYVLRAHGQTEPAEAALKAGRQAGRQAGITPEINFPAIFSFSSSSSQIGWGLHFSFVLFLRWLNHVVPACMHGCACMHACACT